MALNKGDFYFVFHGGEVVFIFLEIDTANYAVTKYRARNTKE